MDLETLALVGGVVALLIVATAVVFVLKRKTDSGVDVALVETFWVRVRAWWLLFAALAGALVIGHTTTVVVFWLISFWALREFITLTPTRPGDHRALFWVFVLCTTLQFGLVWCERYDLYSTLIPMYAFLLVPARIALAGDAKRFLERTAKIQAGLLICVYCFSFAPALLTLDIPGQNVVEGAGAAGGKAGGSVRLLFFFVLLVQLSDALQYAWSKIPSRHLVAPAISSTRTWEGVLGGTASVTLLGTALWFATPFPEWWHAAAASLVIGLMSFAGGLTMSAIKRDRGVRDFGTLVEGHGGVLDRIDSICFAAPAFFHLARYFVGA